MERAVDLPIELRRLIYQRYLQARARHLWNAVRQFVKRLDIVTTWVFATQYAKLTVPGGQEWGYADTFNFKSMKRLAYNVRALQFNEPFALDLALPGRAAYNIRPQRGVKRPLEDFL